MSLPLLFGLLTLPALFCWLLLRRGYESSLRLSVFAYTGAITAVGLVGRL